MDFLACPSSAFLNIMRTVAAVGLPDAGVRSKSREPGGLKIWMVRFRECSNQIPRQLARLAVSNRSRPANHLGNC
jgi:hypothetical protein